jgi:hypothetical protein
MNVSTPRSLVAAFVLAATIISFQNCAGQGFAGFSSTEVSVLKSGVSDGFVTTEDTPLDGQLRSIGKLEARPSTFKALSQPTNGELKEIGAETGKFLYVPGKDYFGQDSFAFSETIEGMDPVVRTAEIKITAANDLPWIVTDALSCDMNSNNNHLVIEAHDIEDTSLSILVSKDGSRSANTPNGQVVSTGPSTITYTPNHNFRGNDYIDLLVRDSDGNSSPNAKRITVTVGNPFHQIQPAMAVRAMACISCHAKVNSTVITDFGFGDDFFFGKKALAVPNRSIFVTWTAASGYTSAYSDHALASWKTAAFTASILVPKAPIGVDLTRHSYTLINASLPDTDTNRRPVNAAITLPIPAALTAQFAATTVHEYVSAIEDQKRVAGLPHSPSIVAKSQIYIGTPDAAKIKADLAIGAQAFVFYKNSSSSPELGGVQVSSAGGVNYVLATGKVTCDGDLGVEGILFLKDVTIETVEGCRIYATGAVFQQGEIKYLKHLSASSSKNLMNLQIISSDSIIMGVGATDCESDTNPGWYHAARAGNYKPLTLRLGSHSVETRRLKLDSPEAIARLDRLTTFAAAAGVQDASCRGGTEPRAVHFERLMLVAPNVQSRYTGNFKGVIIAEFALFSLSKFTFSFDQIFNQVPVLPMIESASYLTVK